jgi:hypothetical protein
MSRVARKHEAAMDLAEAAELARRSGDHARSAALFRGAFENEAEAAQLFATGNGAEPTRSVLLRSAASLALDCGDFENAERLLRLLLAGHPPVEIAQEARELLEQASFQAHGPSAGRSLRPGKAGGAA